MFYHIFTQINGEHKKKKLPSTFYVNAFMNTLQNLLAFHITEKGGPREEDQV